jgi:hypothetical protein
MKPCRSLWRTKATFVDDPRRFTALTLRGRWTDDGQDIAADPSDVMVQRDWASERVAESEFVIGCPKGLIRSVGGQWFDESAERKAREGRRYSSVKRLTGGAAPQMSRPNPRTLTTGGLS